MTLEDFIRALYMSGWDSTADGQHSNIAKLHKKLFPEIARLDSELQDLQQQLFNKGIEL